MNILRLIWAEAWGMFVDDGALALQAVLLIALVAAGVKVLHLPGLLCGAALILGSMLILALSLRRKIRG